MEGQWKLEGGGGGKSKVLKEKCGAKLEFPEGRGMGGANPKILSGGL